MNKGGQQAAVLEDEVFLALCSEPEVQQLFARLDSELDTTLYYHNAAHTHEVLNEVLHLTALDNLDPRDRYLLGFAAIFHDAGFLMQRLHNEPLGAEMAREAMKRAGHFSHEEMSLVSTFILDTTVLRTSQGPRQMASIPLSGYLLDADVSNLGGDQFFKKAELHRRELGADSKEFFRYTMHFLTSHRWNTTVAEKLFEPAKRRNLKELEELVSSTCQAAPKRCITVRDEL